jgi:hypothetical protein
MTTGTKPQSVADTLRAAKKLIKPVGRWNKGSMARTAKHGGFLCSALSSDATCWCAEGAIVAVTRAFDHPAFDVLRQSIGGAIAQFNDARSTTHADVLAAFDRAIALAERLESQP